MTQRRTMKDSYRQWIEAYRNIDSLRDSGIISENELISLEERLLDRIIMEVQDEVK